jgi:MYXO-CTERM domain-containing protein
MRHLHITRAVGAAALTVAVAVSLSGAALIAGAGAALAAGPSGCSYGSGGPEAGAICWLDMSSYDETQAAVGGQQLGVTLPGGYHVTFTVHTAKNGNLPYTSLKATAFPTWSGAYLGNHVYTGTSGKPALYGTAQGGGNVMTLSNIAVTDAAGQPVSSYGFIVADAESSDTQESITFTSDKLLNAVYPATSQFPYCTGGLTGVGSAKVTCVGGPHSGANGAIALQAESPSEISAALVQGGLQGVAFAVVTSDVKLVKQVAGRVNAGDSFDVTVSQGATLGSASTGSANNASTGQITILNTDPITLAEAATAGSGTDLGGYTQNWACTNSATSSDTVLPSGAGTSKQLSLQPGDDVTCTVTNTAPTVDTPIVDPEVGAAAAAVALLGLAGGFALRRRRAHS